MNNKIFEFKRYCLTNSKSYRVHLHMTPDADGKPINALPEDSYIECMIGETGLHRPDRDINLSFHPDEIFCIYYTSFYENTPLIKIRKDEINIEYGGHTDYEFIHFIIRHQDEELLQSQILNFINFIGCDPYFQKIYERDGIYFSSSIYLYQDFNKLILKGSMHQDMFRRFKSSKTFSVS